MRILSTLLLMTAVGCSGKSDDTATDTDTDTDSSGAFTPTEGSWTETSNETISDTCGFGDDGDTGGEEPSTIMVTMTDEDSFSFVVDGDMTFECDLTDQTFACTGEPEEMDMSGDGLNAVMTITGTVVGEFESADSVTLTYTNSVDCEGDDCQTMADWAGTSFPCEFSGTVTATAD